MTVKTFQVRSDNPGNNFQVSTSINAYVYIYLNGYVICCSFMLVNKKIVLNETYVNVHVRWTEKSGNQIWFDWLIESDASPRSFPGVSKFKGWNREINGRLITFKLLSWSFVALPLLLHNVFQTSSLTEPSFWIWDPNVFKQRCSSG